ETRRDRPFSCPGAQFSPAGRAVLRHRPYSSFRAAADHWRSKAVRYWHFDYRSQRPRDAGRHGPRLYHQQRAYFPLGIAGFARQRSGSEARLSRRKLLFSTQFDELARSLCRRRSAKWTCASVCPVFRWQNTPNAGQFGKKLRRLALEWAASGVKLRHMSTLSQRLQLGVQQKQILTPGLVQMVTVLQLNRLELKDMIVNEIAENPVLEEAAERGDELTPEEVQDLLERERQSEPADQAILENVRQEQSFSEQLFQEDGE